jgi:hypothetical protein
MRGDIEMSTFVWPPLNKIGLQQWELSFVRINYAEWDGPNNHGKAGSASATVRHSGTIRHGSVDDINSKA